MVGLTTSAIFTGPAQGAPSQYSSYQQGQGQQYGSYRASQTGPSAQQQRPYGYEQASFLGVSGSAVCQASVGHSKDFSYGLEEQSVGPVGFQEATVGLELMTQRPEKTIKWHASLVVDCVL